MKEIDIEQLRKIQLEILKEVIIFCNNNDIEYFITGGTLLGAVRHGGYIPWDDDIDLAIPRKDYERFITSFNNGRTDRLRVLSIDKDKFYPYVFAKVLDTNTTIEEDNDFNYQISVYVDVFPLDNLTDDMKYTLVLYYKIKFYNRLLYIKVANEYKKLNIFKSFTLKIIKFLLSNIEYYDIISKIDKVSSKYINNDNSKYVGVMSLLKYGKGEIVEREIFSKSVILSFENISVKAPIGYDNYLSKLYGNYMELPPIDKRVSHHKFKAWFKCKD